MNILTERLSPQTEVILNLTRELWVMKDRIRTLEALLAQGGGPSTEAVDGFIPPSDLQAQLDAERDAYLRSVLAPLTRTGAD